MYSDEDGTASKESETIYWYRVRTLLSLNSILSLVGCTLAALKGEYRGESMLWGMLIFWSRLLWPLSLLQSLYLHRSDRPVRLYAAGLHGALLSGLVMVCRILEKAQDNEDPLFDISVPSLELWAATIQAILLISIPRRPDVFSPEGKAVDFENNCSALQRYSMQWCSKALDLAGKPIVGRDPALSRMPILNYRTRSTTQLPITLSGVSLWNHVLAERYRGFAKQWTLTLLRSFVTFGSPYCIMRFLKCLEEDSVNLTNTAWLWLIGVTVSSVSETVLHHHLAWIQWSEMGIPIRAQLIMAIFSKALRVKDFKATGDKPEAINLISSDTASFSMFTAVNYILPFSLIKFLFAVLFLLRLLGWKSTLMAVIVTMITVPVHTRVIRNERAANNGLTVARDRKTKAITEALQALRQIKFSAVETEWEERIELCRLAEMMEMRKRFLAISIRSAWKVASPFIVTAAAVCSYVYIHNEVSSPILFTTIELLPHIQGTLGTVPKVLQDYFGARANAKRMEVFLEMPEVRQILSESPTGGVSFRNASITWPSSDGQDLKVKQRELPPPFILHSLNVEFPAGELSVIQGETGSGKSLMLAAIIGEVDLLSGRIETQSVGQPVAFVSQTPWLQNDTIKNNILFGSPLDDIRYQKVLRACALDTDLAALPKGDETYVGLRGVRLSGGQRARVSLGRALYSSAKLLVLDDIFAALDSHVSNEIFKTLTGELCIGRTRILTTHHVSLCLPKAKCLLQIRNNTVENLHGVDLVKSRLENMESSIAIELNPAAGEKTKGRVIVKPKITTTQAESDFGFYKSYFAATGALVFTTIFVLGLLGKQLMIALTTWILSCINSKRREISTDGLTNADTNTNLRFYVYLYLLGSLSAIVLEFFLNMHIFAGSLRASKKLFRTMTAKVIRMPLLWLDTTPLGEMLKRFSRDARLVDDLLLEVMREFADCFIKLVVVGCIGIHTSIYTGYLTLALLFWCWEVGKGYAMARKPVKRAESESNAEILEYFTAVTVGLSTIRAFRAEDRFTDQMHSRVDKLSIARRYFWIFNRWLGLQMCLMGIIFSTGTGIILLSSKSVVDVSLMGFSLTFSMGFAHASFTAVNNFGMLESYMNAAAGIISYTQLNPEDQSGNDVPADWPSRGEIKIKGLNVAYSADLPLVLKDISFCVEAGQRIGIVGRTGAGKSSLTLALLRLIQHQSGSIWIDGIDISTIKLQSLRSRIAFVPQDPLLFSGTIRSNLDYFKLVPTHKLKDILRRVKLLSIEDSKHAGLFTLESPVSPGGTNMSQGQRQLLCLARMMTKDPKIIILDEATSAVDNESDSLIQDTIRNEFDCTLIVVAHRLRTIASFDKVIVIDDGRIGEIGTPAELLRAKGLFCDFVEKSEDKDFVLKTVFQQTTKCS